MTNDLNLGTTDYMDRFIDEQDPSRDRSSSPNFYSLMFGSEGRKGLSLFPAVSSKSQMQHHNPDSVSNGDVDSNIQGPVSSTNTSNNSTISNTGEISRSFSHTMIFDDFVSFSGSVGASLMQQNTQASSTNGRLSTSSSALTPEKSSSENPSESSAAKQ